MAKKEEVRTVSSWSENWKRSNEGYVKSNPDVKTVLERRKIGEETLYCVGLKKGGFEVRKVNSSGVTILAKPYPTGTKAVAGYRVLRDKLCPNRNGGKLILPAKKEAPKATAKPTKPKPTTKAKSTTKAKPTTKAKTELKSAVA